MADARVADALTSRECAEAVAMFGHVLGAEEIWLARLEQRPAKLGVWPELSPAECVRAAAELADGFRRFRAGLSSDDLGRACSYTTSDGRTYSTPVEDILVHVALHGAYHRGQVATLQRQAGAAPATTDFIELVRGAPAAKTPREV